MLSKLTVVAMSPVFFMPLTASDRLGDRPSLSFYLFSSYVFVFMFSLRAFLTPLYGLDEGSPATPSSLFISVLVSDGR